MSELCDEKYLLQINDNILLIWETSAKLAS